MKKPVQHRFTLNGKEPYRHYSERVLQLENESFTLLVFSVNGGMEENLIHSVVA